MAADARVAQLLYYVRLAVFEVNMKTPYPFLGHGRLL